MLQISFHQLKNLHFKPIMLQQRNNAVLIPEIITILNQTFFIMAQSVQYISATIEDKSRF
jgi:hypothetical protein